MQRDSASQESVDSIAAPCERTISIDEIAQRAADAGIPVVAPLGLTGSVVKGDGSA